MQTTDIMQQLKDEGRREGWEEAYREAWEKAYRAGRREGRQESLLGVYRARFGAVPREVQAAVATAHDQTLTAWLALFATRTEAEILAAITTQEP